MCPLKSQPYSLAASQAYADALAPSNAATPRDRASHSGQARRHNTSAKGLLQVFPVQTNKTFTNIIPNCYLLTVNC
jgi:hypothetical protein